MKKKDLHINFAKALFKLATKLNKAEQFFEEINKLQDFLVDPKLSATLQSLGSMEISTIQELLKSSFGDSLSEPILNMLILLVANQKLKLLPVIRLTFQKLYFQSEGISDVTVCTTRELSPKDQLAMIEKVNKTTGKAKLNFKVDQKLIGGLQIYKNGLLTDFSIKNQLEHLRRQLLGEHI